MQSNLGANISIFLLTVTFISGIALILGSSINAVISNRVVNRLRPIGAVEFRARFDAWVAIPLVGLLVSMVPSLVSWIFNEAGWLPAQLGFSLVVLLVMWFGFFIGVLRYGAERLKGYRSARSLLATIHEMQAAGHVFTIDDLTDIDESIVAMDKQARELSPAVQLAVENLRRERLRQSVRGVTCSRIPGKPDVSLWRGGSFLLKVGWTMSIVSLAGLMPWVYSFGDRIVTETIAWPVLLIVCLVIIGSLFVSRMERGASVEYDAKLYLLEEPALGRLRRVRSSLSASASV